MRQRIWLLAAITLGLLIQQSAAWATTTNGGPPYDDIYATTSPTFTDTDPTGLSTASATSQQNGATGNVSVQASAKSYPLSYFVYSPGSSIEINAPYADATALVSAWQPVSITSGTGKVNVGFTNILVTTTGSGGEASPLVVTNGGGGIVRDYVKVYHYPCTSPSSGCGPDWLGDDTHDLNIVFYGGFTEFPSASSSDTRTVSGVPAGGYVVVQTGLYAVADAQGGPAQFTADGSATVSSISTP